MCGECIREAGGALDACEEGRDDDGVEAVVSYLSELGKSVRREQAVQAGREHGG